MKKRSFKQLIYLLLSLSLTVGLGWYFFSHHSLSDVFDAIRGVPREYIFSFIVFSLLMSFFRAWRYLLLLRANGYDSPPISLFLITIVRNLFSDLLPARLGTLVYIYLVNTRLGVPFSAATSSFAYAFLFDIIAVCPLIAFCLFAFVVPAEINIGVMITGVIVIFVIAATLIVFLPQIASFAVAILHKLRWKQATKVEQIIEGIRDSLQQVRAAKIYGRVLILSVITRSFKYAGLYVFLLGLGHSLGLSREILLLERSLLGLLAAEFAASLPVSGISGFGAYEGAWAFTFSLLGVEQRLAEMTAFSHHLFTQAYGYIIGLGALALLLLPIFARGPQTAQLTKLASIPQFAIQILVALLVGFSVAIAPLSLAQENPSHQEAQSSEWQAGQQLPAIVFDSNRSGRFGIYGLEPATGVITKIKDTSAHEMFPDISPDKKQLAFSRHLSLSRQSPADVVIISLATGEEVKIENGTYPTFSRDGEKLYFERGRTKVMEFDIRTKELKEIFPAGKFPEFKSFQVVKPRLSSDKQKIVFTSDKGGRWHAWLADLEKKTTRMIGQGCEPVFHPNGKSIIWVGEKEMRQGSGFNEMNLETGEMNVFHDQDQPWGREYFPTFSNDGTKLLFSAAPPGDHSHETANYQLFYLDTESGEVEKLIEDEFTNRWPKFKN